MGQKEKATLVGAWQAFLGPRINATPTRKAYAYTAYGSYKLTLGSKEYILDLTAVGFFTDIYEDSKVVAMDSVGPSEFKDLDGDLLRADGVAKDNVLWFEFAGGTGKWSKAKGRITVDDRFTHSDNATIRAFESGVGELEI
jgi:hypothetical protein